MAERRPVSVSGVGLLSPAGIGADGLTGGEDGGPVPSFKARNYVADRKSLQADDDGGSVGCLGGSNRPR